MSKFETTDLGLAAFLIIRGHALLGIERIPGDYRRKFHFPPEARQDVDPYFNGATIPARSFNNAVRDLKTRVRTT